LASNKKFTTLSITRICKFLMDMKWISCKINHNIFHSFIASFKIWNGWYLWSPDQLSLVFLVVEVNPSKIHKMKKNGYYLLQVSRAMLQRYLFYCNRYMNHMQSLKFENKVTSCLLFCSMWETVVLSMSKGPTILVQITTVFKPLV
jgi:hypothetical protein